MTHAFEIRLESEKSQTIIAINVSDSINGATESEIIHLIDYV
jgi:hypothetical protein